MIKKKHCKMYWTTEDEIKFLIDTGTEKFGERLRDRNKTLKGYREAFNKRVTWGAIDKNKVDLFLKMEGF
jgi:hypothetical protein